MNFQILLCYSLMKGKLSPRLNLTIQMISELMIIYVELLAVEDRTRMAQFN